MDQPPSLLDLAHEEHGDAPNGGGGSGDEARATLDEQEILDDINLDEIEEALREAQEQQRMDALMQPPPRRHGAANTGAKGVLADYAEAKEKARLRRQARAEALYLQMKDKTITVKPSSRDEEEEDEESDDNEHKKELELDPDDEDFIRMYREKRLQELQASQRRTFGCIKSISAYDFADEIDAEAESGAFVVIHLYKTYLAMCVRMNHILQKLAQRFSYVKFMKIISTEADANYDDVALPTLLIYQRGDLAKSLIRVPDELPAGWDQDDVEALLRKHGVLPAKVASRSPSVVNQYQDW